MVLTGDNKAEDRETLPAALLLWHVFRRESRAFKGKAMDVRRVERSESRGEEAAGDVGRSRLAGAGVGAEPWPTRGLQGTEEAETALQRAFWLSVLTESWLSAYTPLQVVSERSLFQLNG